MGISRAPITRRPAHPVKPVEQAIQKHQPKKGSVPAPGPKPGSRSVSLPQSSVRTTE